MVAMVIDGSRSQELVVPNGLFVGMVRGSGGDKRATAMCVR